MWNQRLNATLVALLLAGCGGGLTGTDDNGPDGPDAPNNPPVTPPAQGNQLDTELRTLITANGLTGDPSLGRDLPSIDDPVATLGKRLFFTMALGGEFDSACVSCHHPVLGGGDGLSLPVGIGAVDPELLGPGRQTPNGQPNVPRNAPTTFNLGLWDASLFMDSRVESFGKEALANGAASGISTPDSGFGVIDVDAGANLATAQARFPVTSVEEMRGDFAAGESNAVLRAHLAARIGGYGAQAGVLASNDWLAAFQLAFSSAADAEALITYDNIALALAEYQRSQVFVDNAWRSYVQGNDNAISNEAKEGAILFLTESNDGGAGCVECHSGDLFSDERQHAIGAPQFGPGKGVGPNGSGDFGRELVTGNPGERFRFRTPSLLNVEVTGPYMHTGAYESLNEVLRHYDDPDDTVDDFFDDGGWCDLEQFEDVANCATLYPNARANSNLAIDRVRAERNANDPDALPNVNLNGNERDAIVAFLRTLTDPCVESRTCLAPWIATPAEAADSHQVEAVDINGNPL